MRVLRLCIAAAAGRASRDRESRVRTIQEACRKVGICPYIYSWPVRELSGECTELPSIQATRLCVKSFQTPQYVCTALGLEHDIAGHYSLYTPAGDKTRSGSPFRGWLGTSKAPPWFAPGLGRATSFWHASGLPHSWVPGTYIPFCSALPWVMRGAGFGQCAVSSWHLCPTSLRHLWSGRVSESAEAHGTWPSAIFPNNTSWSVSYNKLCKLPLRYGYLQATVLCCSNLLSFGLYNCNMNVNHTRKNNRHGLVLVGRHDDKLSNPQL